MSHPEPILVRCSRCDALVAVNDAAACGRHETAVLCHHCWTHHIASQANINQRLSCWAQSGLMLWRDPWDTP